MNDWKKVKLGEVCKIKSGKRLPKGCEFSDTPTKYKYIRARDIKNGIINGEELAYITEETQYKISKYIVNSDDIVITIVGASVGDVAYISSQYNGVNLTENAVRLTQFNTDVNSRYLFYILNSPNYYQLMQRIAGGAAQPKMGIYKVEAIEVYLPSLSTQQRIATILSRYDSLIENYQKQIKLLEESAQRLYKEWFIDLRFPGHENTKIVDGVPEGWKKNTINDVCTLITSGSTPSRNKNSYWEDGTIRWVKTKELLDSWILDTEEYITQEGYNNSSTKLFPANTILMAIYASPTLGRLGILSAECCCNQAALGLIADEKVISWQWLFWKLYELRDEFNAIARGAGQQNISGIVVKNKEIVIPAKRVIDRFTSVVSTMFEQQKNLQLQIRILTEARNRLLPKLMSGEINV